MTEREKDKEYPHLSPRELEPHYAAHVYAMTAEGLRNKHDIAMQLAWRDQRIAELERELEITEEVLDEAQTRRDELEELYEPITPPHKYT